MTRGEAKAAMDAGKKIGWKTGSYAFYDLEHEYGPYVLVYSNGTVDYMQGMWDDLEDTYILPDRKTRPCTQLEVLAIQTKPNRVYRVKGMDKIYPSQSNLIHEEASSDREWAEFNQDGTLGPWHDFVVEEEA